MNKSLHSGLRTWIEIDRKAIKHNYDIFRKLISSKTKLMTVVKSNAYGHCLIDFSNEMEKLGTDYLAVDSIVEGIALRKNGIKKPILVLGYTLPEMLIEAIEYNLEITVSSFETFKEIKKQNLHEIKIHIKVDTGMGRHGFLLDQKAKVMKEIKGLNIVGIYTHFSSAKNPSFPQYTKNQFTLFQEWIDLCKKNNLNPLKHACATSGTILFPEYHLDMVRIGIGMYGIWPSHEVKEFINDRFKLLPILTWKTIVSEVKELSAGSKIGYDGIETLERQTKIVMCPIGYWHGYPRALSSIGKVLINGKKCKVLGRVCMDIIIVDISEVKNIKTGNEVTLIGKEISAEYVSTVLEGSPYELLTRINPLIKRIFY